MDERELRQVSDGLAGLQREADLVGVLGQLLLARAGRLATRIRKLKSLLKAAAEENKHER